MGVVIAGAHEVTPTRAEAVRLSARPVHSAVARAALDNAGLTFADVDGLAATGTLMASSELGEHLGINPQCNVQRSPHPTNGVQLHSSAIPLKAAIQSAARDPKRGPKAVER
jgi:hypothetical protein